MPSLISSCSVVRRQCAGLQIKVWFFQSVHLILNIGFFVCFWFLRQGLTLLPRLISDSWAQGLLSLSL